MECLDLSDRDSEEKVSVTRLGASLEKAFCSPKNASASTKDADPCQPALLEDSIFETNPFEKLPAFASNESKWESANSKQSF